jgi:hypothetical protein
MNKPIFRNGNSSDDWLRIDLNGYTHVIIANDSGANTLAFSFDGVNIHGFLYGGDSIPLPDVNVDAVYLKSFILASSAAYRFWAFGDRNLIYAQGNIIGNNAVPVPTLDELQNMTNNSNKLFGSVLP